jgi:Predicted transcriptional regulators
LIGSDVLRGYNDTILLHILADGDSYGYELSKEIAQRSGDIYIIKETTLYSAIARLEKNGHVSSYIGEKTYGKQRTYYTITEIGRQYYKEKCAEWHETKQLMKNFTIGENVNE